MIYTVTLNPALDRNYKVESLSVGQLNRATAVTFNAGGKGINVSRALNSLNCPNYAVLLLGKNIGKLIKSELKHFRTKQVSIESDNRINVKLIEKGNVTEIMDRSPYVSSEEIEKVVEILSKSTERDIIILSGSLPQSDSKGIYGYIVSKVKATVFLDTSGEALLGTYDKCTFVKPNLDEIMQLTGCNSDASAVAKALVEISKSVPHATCTLGGDGALAVDGDKVYQFKLSVAEPIVSSVGCGDSFVAGYVYGFLHKKSFFDRMKFAVACGSVNAVIGKCGVLDRELIDKYVELVEVIEV